MKYPVQQTSCNIGIISEIECIIRDAVDANGWVNLEILTGLPQSHIPKFVREPDDPITHCSSLTALVGDPACDPRAGGIGGVKRLAAIYGISEQHFRRHILPNLPWIRWLANIPMTNVASVCAHKSTYKMAVYETRCGNLGIDFDVSSGHIH